MAQAKRLLFISQHFHPETFRGNDIAFDMAKRGVEVTAIVGVPNYPKGKFFDGYGLFKRNKEYVNGVRVIRVPVIPRGNGGKMMLVLNFLSYFIVASLYLPFHLLFNKKYDACFVQQLSPVLMSMPGIVFTTLTGRPMYTWVLDLWPESLRAAAGIENKHILKAFEAYTKWEYRKSKTIFVSSEGYANNIKAKGNFGDKIDFLPNWAEDVILKAERKEIPELPDKFTVIFTGNVGEAQDFNSIVEAAKNIKPEDEIQIVIVGDGRKKEWVDAEVAKHNLQDRLIMLGRFDISYMSAFYDRADALLFSLKDVDIFNLCIPAKVQAYLAAGKPVVAMINGDGQKIINDNKCGIAVNAGDYKGLVESIKHMMKLSQAELAAMGLNGKNLCQEKYDKTKVLDHLYNTIFA